MFETFFRKRFVVVHLALSALLAFLLAQTVSSFLARLLTEKLQVTATASRPPLLRAVGVARDFAAAANANIFEGKRDLVIDVADADHPPVDVDGGNWWDAPKSSLRLRLVGTIAFSSPEFSLASVVDEGKGGSAAEVYSVNDCADVDLTQLSAEDQKLMGRPQPCNKIGDIAVVKRIEPERIYILNSQESRIEYLALNEPPANGEPAPAVAKVEKAPEGDGKDIGEGIVKTGENTYGVPRSTVDGALNNLSELATQARVVPAFEGGKAVGFKLFSIKPGSLYSKIGLQNGDVINRINGYEMSSPEKGLEVYSKLKDSPNITVDVKRRGKAMSLDYAIQ